MIEVVGIGLEGAAGLNQKAQKIVDRATLLVGSKRHLSYFPNHPAQRIILDNFVENFQQIKEAQSVHQFMVILVSGDPLFFGLGRLLLEYFPPEQLEFYPHLSCIQLVFNRLKMPWQDAKIISGHGRELDELITSLKQGLKTIAILTDKINNPSAIARLYLSLNLSCDYEFWVAENLGNNTENIERFSALELSHHSPDGFASLNVVILSQKPVNQSPEINLEQLPLFGLSDHLFLTFQDRPGLITKREIRIHILGELELQNQQIIWDIGAGTGSVSIEIARLCPKSQIYSIEKTAMGINLIKKNCQRFEVFNVAPISGNAPNILMNLPQPDRIFIGGSGGNLREILEVCQQRLAENGVLVIALATLENLSICLDWFREKSWDYHVSNLQISLSTCIGNLTRLSPLNPTFLLRAKPNFKP